MSYRDLYFSQYESPNIVIVPTLSFSSPPEQSPEQIAADPSTNYCEEIASVTDNICVPSGSNDHKKLEVMHTSTCTPEFKDHIRSTKTPPNPTSQSIKELSTFKYKSRNNLVDLTGFNLLKMNNTNSLTKSKKFKQIDNKMKIGPDKINSKNEKEHQDDTAHRDTSKPDKISNKNSSKSVKPSSTKSKENHDNDESKENTIDMKEKMKKYFLQLWKTKLDKLEDKKCKTVKSSSRKKQEPTRESKVSTRSKANLQKLSKSNAADDLKNKITRSKKYRDLDKSVIAKYSERSRDETNTRHQTLSDSKETRTKRKIELSPDSIKRYKDFQRFTRLTNSESKYKNVDQNKIEKIAQKKKILIKPCETTKTTTTKKRDIKNEDERSSSIKHSVKIDKQSKISTKQTDTEIVKYHTNMEMSKDQTNKKTRLIKSVVHVDKNLPEHSQSKCLNEVEDLRSKLSRKRTNSECLTYSHEPVKKRYERENLVITVKQDVSPDSKKTAPITPNVNKPKPKKCKKLKLIINIECPNSDSNDSDQDSNKCSPSPEDLSFLDDFNIDEIADSLNNSQVELNKVITTDNIPRIVSKVIEKIHNKTEDNSIDKKLEENKPKDDPILDDIQIKEEKPSLRNVQVIEINSDTEDGDLNLENRSVANKHYKNEQNTETNSKIQGINNIADLNENVNTQDKTVDLCDNSNDSVVEVIDITEEDENPSFEHSFLTGNTNSANLNKITSNVDQIFELLNRPNKQNEKSHDTVNTNDGQIKLEFDIKPKLELSDVKDQKQAQLQISQDPIEVSLATMFNSSEQKESVINTCDKRDVINKINVINIKEEKEKSQNTEDTVEASLETMFNNLEQNGSKSKQHSNNIELNRFNGCDKKAKSNSDLQKPVDVEELLNKKKTERPLESIKNVVGQKILNHIEPLDVNNKHIKIEPEYLQKSEDFNRESKILIDTDKNIISQKATIEENAKVNINVNISQPRIISSKPLENNFEKRAHNKIVTKPLWNPNTENTEQIDKIEDAQIRQKYIQELEHDRIDMFKERPQDSENTTNKALTLNRSIDNNLIKHKEDISVQKTIKPLQKPKENIQAKKCAQKSENKFNQKNQKAENKIDAGKPTITIERKPSNDKPSLPPKNNIQEKLDCMYGSENSSNENLERAITILEKSLITFMTSNKPLLKSEEKPKTSFKPKHLITKESMLAEKAKHINKTLSCTLDKNAQEIHKKLTDKPVTNTIKKNTNNEKTSIPSTSYCPKTKKSIQTEKKNVEGAIASKQGENNNAKIKLLKKASLTCKATNDGERTIGDVSKKPLETKENISEEISKNKTPPCTPDINVKTNLLTFEDTDKKATNKSIENNINHKNTSPPSKSFRQETKKSFNKNVMVPRQVKFNNAKIESLKKPLPNISKKTPEKGDDQQKAIITTCIESKIEDKSAKTSTKIEHLPKLEDTDKIPTEKSTENNTNDEKTSPSSKNFCQKTKEILQIPKTCTVSPQVENNNAKIEASKESQEHKNNDTSEPNKSDKKKIPLLPLPNMVVISKKSPESQHKPKICTNIDSNLGDISAKTPSQPEKSNMKNNKKIPTTKGSNIENQAKSSEPVKNDSPKLETINAIMKTEDSNIKKTNNDNPLNKPWEVVTESAEMEEKEADTEINTTFKILNAKLQSKVAEYFQTKGISSSTIRYGKYSTIFKYCNVKRQKYAVKVVHRRKSGLLIQEMLNQMQQYRSMQDSCVLYLFNGFDIQGRICLLTEFFPKNLTEALRENQRSFHIDQVQHLSMQLVDAVNMLTNAGIIHSDIKPAHILLNSENNRLKLCGFDQATYAQCANITPDTGTPSYRAPEVIMGFLEDHRIDAWSTALVMFEMATYSTLFPAYYNNCVLYYQLCTLGNIDWTMVEQSRHGRSYFVGTSFKRETGSAKRPKSYLVPTMHRNNRLRRTLFVSYDQQWAGERTGREQVINDRSKLEALHTLLEQMLIMDPRHRLPIQFVPASEFMNYQFTIA